MNLIDVRQALECLSSHQPILLVGPPGVGKSEICASFAKEKKAEFIGSHVVIHDPTDYRGLPAVIDGNAEWFPSGWLKQICNPNCPPTVVLLDDLGQGVPAVQAALMQLVLERISGDHKIADSVSFLLATNRSEDRSGVRAILSALINRVLIIEVEADPLVSASWMLKQLDIHPLFPSYARFRAGDLFVKEVPVGINAYCTPRSLAQAGRLYSHIQNWPIKQTLLSGLIGPAIAADFTAYAKVAAALPDMQELLSNNYKLNKWVVPSDLGLLHAIVSFGAKVACQFPNGAIKLAEKLGHEWGTALISNAVDVDAKFKSTPDFEEWAVKNKDILL